VGGFASPTVTHLIKDPIGALGADSTGAVTQAMAGPQVDDAIAKKIEMISSNPFDAPPADESNENLKEVHNKIQRYLGKLDKLYAIAEPEKDDDTPKQYAEKESTNSTSDEDDEQQQDEEINLKLPQLRKAVLTAAIKKAASSALHAADSKMKEDSAAEEARHTAAIQNLTSVALKEKAGALTAKWRVQQALKEKKKQRDALTKLQTHEMKTQMAINTLTEHDAQIKLDIAEAEKEVAEAHKVVQEKTKAYKEQMKVFNAAQNALLEEKATQIQELFEQQSNKDNTASDQASSDSDAMARFLSARSELTK